MHQSQEHLVAGTPNIAIEHVLHAMHFDLFFPGRSSLYTHSHDSCIVVRTYILRSKYRYMLYTVYQVLPSKVGGHMTGLVTHGGLAAYLANTMLYTSVQYDAKKRRGVGHVVAVTAAQSGGWWFRISASYGFTVG